MAVNNQHHNHANSATSPSSSSSSAAYQHFQPWRSSSSSSPHQNPVGVKTELFIKKEIIDHSELSPRDYHLSQLHHHLSMQNNNHNNHHHGNQQHQLPFPPHPLHPPPPSSAPFPPLQGPPAAVRGTMATYRDGNPELEQVMQQCIEEGNGSGGTTKEQIVRILESVQSLRPPERVLLYLRMPGANCEADPLRQAQNPLGARSEINHTINWVRSHLEPDPNVSIPKKDVYDDYLAFCARNNIKPLSTADFGKVMKQVFPTVRPRRLGTRGHSRYCYAAMRKATKLDPPMLPDLTHAQGSTDVSVFSNGPVQPSCSTSPPYASAASNKGAELEESGPTDRASWLVIRKWAQGILNIKVNTAKELADHIVSHQLNLDQPGHSRDDMAEAGGSGTAGAAGGSGGAVKESKKIKDKRKEPPKKAASPRKRRQKPRKNSTSCSENGDGGGGGSMSESEPRGGAGPSKAAKVRIKKEAVGSGNDEDRIINLKLTRNIQGGEGSATGGQTQPHRAPPYAVEVKIKLNDVPMDENATAAEEDPQIENVYCKKVRQAQQAKGLWFQQQQQQQPQPGQPSSSGHSSVIVTPHTFSQPEIPSPSMLNQMNQQLRVQQQQQLQDSSQMPKNLMNKRGDGGGGVGDDGTTLPSDFILPRERVISICNMDKDALDDYLPLAGDNSQEAEIMQYFDDNSSNGQSTGTTENSSPKEEGAEGTTASNAGGAGGGGGGGPVLGEGTNNATTAAPSIMETYSSMFPDQGRPPVNAGKQMDGPEKIHQLRQFLHQNFQSGNNLSNRLLQNAMAGQNMAAEAGPYPGSAAASLAMLSQRHNSLNYPPQVNVGMDLTQDPMGGQPMAVVSGRPVSLKKRVMAAEIIPEEDEPPQHRRFVPITPPQGAAPAVVVDYTSGKGRMEPAQSRYDDFLSPKMAAMKKQQAMNILRPTVSQGNAPLSSNHQGSSHVDGIPMGSANGIFQADERKTAFSKPTLGGGKYIQQQPSPGGPSDKGGNYMAAASAYDPSGYANHDGGQALNMSYAESRSQSVPLNYRQSPVQSAAAAVVTSSNDGTASWSSSYQANNNAPSSACSSVAQTPIPPEYNDFTDLSMMNMWETDSVAEEDGGLVGGGGGVPQPQQLQPGDKLFKDRNNNNEDDFIEELKEANGFGGYAPPSASGGSIVSRSVPSTPLPMGGPGGGPAAGYYGKGYFNGNGATFAGGGPSYSSADQRHGAYDASKSVPTTPISTNRFRYSPVSSADVVLNRSRDLLINGNCIGGGLEGGDNSGGGGDVWSSSASNAGFGAGGGEVENDGRGEGLRGGGGGGGEGSGSKRGSGDPEMIEGAARRKRREEEDILEKEMDPLEDEMGFDDTIMETDLMNQFKGEF